MNNSIGLVISTLNDGIFKIKEMLYLPCEEIVLVHQVTDQSKIKEYLQFYSELDQQQVRLITMQEKGLSKSRNAGISAVNSDYFLICDDDGVFVPDLISILKSTIEKYGDADIMTFKTQTPDGRPYKRYKSEPFRHRKRTTAKVTSREILIRREFITRTKQKFDERFGLGSDIPTGEEYIFLCDALRQQAVIWYIPEFIVIHPYESSGKDFNDRLIQGKGAVFARTYGGWCWLVNLIFALKKYDHYKNTVSFFRFLKLIFTGSYRFLKNG